jgi:hypothetical protein
LFPLGKGNVNLANNVVVPDVEQSEHHWNLGGPMFVTLTKSGDVPVTKRDPGPGGSGAGIGPAGIAVDFGVTY